MAKINDTTLLEAWIQEISRRTGLSPGELARRFRPGASAPSPSASQQQRPAARPAVVPPPSSDDRAPPPSFEEAPVGDAPFGDAPFGDAPFDDGPLPPRGAAPVELAPLNPLETELIVLLHRRAALLLPFLHARTDISMEQREVAEWAREVAAKHQESGPSLSRAFELLEEGPLKSVIARALMLAGPLYEEKIQSAFHAVSQNIRRAWVVATRARLIVELEGASKRGDDEGAFLLLNQLQRLNEFERDTR
jgi:hypothetical protein